MLILWLIHALKKRGKNIANDRVKKHLISALKNDKVLNSNYFLQYAGHVKIFSENEEVKFKELKTSDYFENNKIQSGFEKKHFSATHIKETLVDYWDKYEDLNYKKIIII